MELSDAVRKVQSLLALANHESATVGEAATAGAMAQRLIEKFNIDAVLLSQAKAEGAPAEDETVKQEVLYTFDGPRVATWALNLFGALGDVNGCKVWYRTGRYGQKGALEGCGRESDLAAVRYMMQYLINEIERLCDSALRKAKREGESCGKTWGNSFKLGAVSEISYRIREESKRAREEMKNPELAYKRAIECGDTQRIIELDKAQKYELAVVEKALAKLDERKKKAEQWAEEALGKFRKGPGRAGAKNYGAYGAGREAGRTVNLSNNSKRLT